MQRTSSPISDPEPLQMPDEEPAPTPKPTDFERMAKSSKWPQIKQGLEQRREFYQTYLPDGTAIASKDAQITVNNWVVANAIIAEINNLIGIVEANGDVGSVPRS